MNKKTTISLIVLLALILVGGFLIYKAGEDPSKNNLPLVTNFEECAKYYPVMESYPRQCQAPGSIMFVEDTSALERGSVENYVRANISTLSPVKPVLGGTWQVVSLTVDLEKNSGTVTYEDGHIQEKRNFTYTTNENSEVASLVIENTGSGTSGGATTGGDGKHIACTMDAKLCPDGSYVGRTAPKCEFAACPSNPITLTAKLNQSITWSGVTGKITEVVEDSRCPAGAQCVWAGTVKVKASFKYGASSQTTTLTLNEPYTFSGRTVTLIGVKPEKTSGTIPLDEYIFTLSVK